RRHTSSKRDWSSDVCSSDLRGGIVENIDILHIYIMDVDVFDNTAPAPRAFKANAGISANKVHIRYRNIAYTPRHLAANHKTTVEIGRASWRETVENSGETSS